MNAHCLLLNARLLNLFNIHVALRKFTLHLCMNNLRKAFENKSNVIESQQVKLI